MDLTPHAERLRDEVEQAAEALGDEARALVARLLGPLDAATRLVLLDALSEAAEEITRDLAPGSVELRLRRGDAGFAVTAPAAPPEPEPAPAPPPGPAVDAAPDTADGATTRINLRLPDGLKTRAEEAAAAERLSLNAWLVRAAAAALDPVSAPRRPDPRTPRGRHGLSGWVR